jgi:hypothetical protein
VSDIALTDANFKDGWDRLSPYRVLQGWDHGPVQLTRPWLNSRPGNAHVRAMCLECDDWVGPARDGDPNSLRLVEDDAIQHIHQMEARCGVCEVCLPDGALSHHE